MCTLFLPFALNPLGETEREGCPDRWAQKASFWKAGYSIKIRERSFKMQIGTEWEREEDKRYLASWGIVS